MARAVSDDELAPRRGEVAVGDVDGDALLALGLQAVGQERKVDLRCAAALRRALDGGELVLLHRARVIQETPDQRALAVVDAARGGESERLHLEIPFLLPALHGGVGGLVVHARGAALGELGHGGLFKNFLYGEGIRFNRARAADVAHGAETDRDLLYHFVRTRRRDRRHRHDQAAAAHDGTAVRVVDGRHFQLLARDVLPYVELGPVADREDPHVLAGMHARVVQAPQLGPLVARIPLAEFVAEGEHAFLGARLLFVAARAADGGVELEFADS